MTLPSSHQPPTAKDDTYSTRQAKLLTVDAAHGVLANDTDIDSPTLTAEIVHGPAHARSFALAADGSFSYRPVASFRGTDSFTYEDNDGQSVSAPATGTIFVTAPRNPGPMTAAAGSQGFLRADPLPPSPSAPPAGSSTSLESTVLARSFNATNLGVTGPGIGVASPIAVAPFATATSSHPILVGHA